MISREHLKYFAGYLCRSFSRATNSIRSRSFLCRLPLPVCACVRLTHVCCAAPSQLHFVSRSQILWHGRRSAVTAKGQCKSDSKCAIRTTDAIRRQSQATFSGPNCELDKMKINRNGGKMPSPIEFPSSCFCHPFICLTNERICSFFGIRFSSSAYSRPHFLVFNRNNH